MSASLPQLHMRRALDTLPELVVPAGYGLRTFEPGDGAAWAALLDRNGELDRWSAERAAPYFAADSRMPLAGSFFITCVGDPVATAQLHLKPEGPYAPTPEMGWVGVSPAHRGRNLGYVVSLAVMHYAASAGHKAIFLLTDDHRLPAVRTYLRLGFQPWMVDPSAPERWRAVFAQIDRYHSKHGNGGR